MPKREFKRVHSILLALCVTGLVVAAFHGALSAGFVFDDNMFFDLPCWQIESADELASVPAAPGCSYRRVRFVSLAVDHLLWGPEPFGFHLTNLILHGLIVLLVFHLFRRLGLHPLASAAGALIWGLHPTSTDVVTYVAGRRDLLTTFFFLLALWAWPMQWKRRSIAAVRIVGSLVLFVLAFESKEMAITLPAIIVLQYLFIPSLDAARKGEDVPSPWQRIVPLLRRYWIALVAIGILTVRLFIYRVFEASVSSHPLRGGDIFHHLLSIPSAYAKYLELVLFPHRLYGDYSDYPAASGLGDFRVWLGLVVLVAIWLFAFRQAKRRPYLSFGLFWFAVTMLPVSQIVPHHEFIAEHYLFLPLIGLAVAAARGLEVGYRQPRLRPALIGALVLVSALFTAKIVDRNQDFQSQRTFAETLLAHVPDSMRGHMVMASAQHAAGEYEDAIENLEWLIERATFNDKFHRGAWENLLTTLFNDGQFDEAARRAQEMLAFYPNHPHPYRVLGTVRAQRREFEEALPYHERALELDPSNIDGHLHIGMILLRLERLDEAETHLEYVATRRRRHPQAQLQWAMLARAQGNLDVALERYEWVLELEPNNVWALDGAVRVAGALGDVDKMCGYFDRLKVLRPELADVETPCN